MTTEEIKNLFPLKMRIIPTTKEKGVDLLNGKTVTDSNGNEYAMGDDDIIGVPDVEYYMHHLNIGYLDTQGSDWKSIQARYSFLHTSSEPLTLSDLNGSDIYTFVITNTSTDGGNTYTSTYNTILTIYNGLVYPHDFPMEDGLSYTGYSPTTFEDIVTEIGVFPPNTAKPIIG